MEPLAILREAEEAGLKLRVEGDKLVVSGPRKAEPIVHRLAERKAEVIAALAATAPVSAEPEKLTHPWTPEAQVAALAADTGLAIDELDRDWPASAWRRLYAARVRFWTMPRSDMLGNVTRHLNGDWIAWGDLQNRWHKRYGDQPTAELCAGCGEAIGNAEALTLSGAQTHLGRDPDCLTAYGRKWRAAADAGLMAMGLAPPEGREP